MPASPPLRTAKTAEAVPGFSARQWWLLLAVTALGAALRAWHLGAWSLWGDEGFTWRDATMPLAGEDGFLRSDRALYPLAFLTVRGILRLHAELPDEALLRLPFAVVGALTVPVLALCGRRVVGPAAALVAAALLALDPWHEFWSQNARGYVGVVFAAAVAINRAHAYAQQERVRDFVAALLAIGLGVLAHATSWMLLVALVGYLLTRFLPDRRETRQRLLLAGLVFAVVMPWVLRGYPLFPQILASKKDTSLLHFVETTAYYFRPVVLLSALAALLASRALLDRQRAVLLGCCTVLPFLSLSIVSAELLKLTARYAICTLPAVLWLAGLAAVEVTRRLWRARRHGRWMVRLAGAAVPLVMAADRVDGMVRYHQEQFGQRARWREACEFAATRAREHGFAGLRVVAIQEAVARYYLRPWHWRNDEVDPYPEVEVLGVDKTLARDGEERGVRYHEPGAGNHLEWQARMAAEKRRCLMFLVTLPELAELDPDGALQKAITTRCDLVAHFPCWVGPKDESLYVYQLRRP